MSNILVKLLPLLLPIVAYLVWWRLTRGKALAQGQPPPELAKGPWAYLIAAGLVLVLAGLIYTGITSGEPPGGTYVPPSYQDGRIVPGHIDR
jgi:hypothetical protein